MNARTGGHSSPGYLVLEQAIDEITIGRTYRSELGDLADLRESIEKLGLLCPIVITVDGVLISGRRRLEVMRQLGRTTVPVWVAAEVSDELRTLLAIQDDNLLRKDLTATEKADLYAEYKALLAEENARRQAATRFGATDLAEADNSPATSTSEQASESEADGGWESQPPSKRKSRVQAAQAVTGRDSSQQLEEVLTLQRLATDEDADERVRRAAAEALMQINDDGKVHGRYHQVRALQGVCWLEKTAVDDSATPQTRDAAAEELTTVAGITAVAERARAVAAAVARVRKLSLTPATASTDAEEVTDGALPAAVVRGLYHARRLVDILARVEGWWDSNDPALIGEHATDEQWAQIITHRQRATAFLDAAAEARARTRGTG